VYSIRAGSQLLHLLERLLENLSFGVSDFLQEVQFVDVEDYEL